MYSTTYIFSQNSILAFGTVWDDAFEEVFLVSDNEEEGSLEIRWKLKNDWSEWDYSLEDKSGFIKQKWKNKENQWELRSHDGVVVEMQQKWRNDFSEWRIKENDVQVSLLMPNKNDKGYWLVEDKRYGFFELFTLNEFDLRDWECIDELNSSFSFEFKLAIVFMAYYSSVRL